MRIVAVDPGKRTGIAVYEESFGVRRFNSWEAETWEAVEWVDRLLTGPYPVLVPGGELVHPGVGELVVEAYYISAQTLRKGRGDNWSLESIGALRYLARRHEVPFFLQSAGDAKKFATDEKLKAAGFWRPSRGGHRNDAGRHVILREARARGVVLWRSEEAE